MMRYLPAVKPVLCRQTLALLSLFFLGLAFYGEALAQSNVVGRWSSVPDLPFFPVHVHVLPTGKVLIWPGDLMGTPPGVSGNDPRLWDPATASITPATPPGYDVFCSGHSFLPNGQLFVAGGHIENGVGLPDASAYDPFTNTWTSVPDMAAGRWYPTATTLANGDVLVTSGNIDNSVGENRLPGVFQIQNNSWRDLTNAQISLDLYPRMHLAPNGKVFNSAPSTLTRYLDTSGTGAWTVVGNRSVNVYRDYGSSVQYDSGKILLAGGSDPPTNTAEVIDLNSASPAWRAIAPMQFARRQPNATILPDGKVLVTGGTSGPGFNNTNTPVFAAEMWDPITENWTTMASAQTPRLYHSAAVLLPDGRILTTGGNGFNQAEVYEPPYLFKGTRPTITAAPAAVSHGQSFSVATPDGASINQVTLIALSSTTHAFDSNQRINQLSFSRVTGALNVVAPSDPNLAPPGYYMLFVLNGNGVPSIASTIQITPASAGQPAVTVAATDANAAEAGLNTGVFTVSRTGSTAAALTVNYTVGGTATNGTDYQSLPGTVTIAAGAGSATITVTPIDDASAEGNETVTVTLAAGSGYTVGAPNAATVTIADNEVLPPASITLSFDGQIRDRVGGGETALSADGAADGTFTVTLSAASGNRTVTRLDLARTGEGNWDTQPNNNFWVAGAASGLDNPLFNAANGTVNFALTAGSSFRIFVSDFQARMFGTGSTFNLTVTFSDGSTAVASTGIAGQPTVTVAATDASAAEAGLNTGVFTVSRTGSTAAALTVNYTVGGTATNGTDYQSLPGTVTIAAGAGSATITVTPIDDASAEGNETVTVTLAAGSGYTVGPPNAAMVTIADNDVAPAPSITLSFDGQIRDRVGGGETALSADGAADGTFTVTLSAASGNRTVTRLDLARTGEGNWDTQPNNNFWVAGAASGLDNPLFNAANGTVNFALTAGSSFRIFVSDFQARMFGTGSTFNLTVTFSDGSTAVASTGIAAQPTVTVAATDANAAEAGLNTGVFTVSRTGSTAAALTVNYTVGGTATNGTDYQSLPGTVTIAAGAGSATITVTPIDDASAEGDETVTVTLAAGSGYTVGAPNAATVTIADNDVTATVTVAATDANAAEAGLNTGVFTVSRTGSTAAALTVNYTVGGTATNGTDYQSLPGTVTIAAGAGSATITVTPIDDASAEGNETVTVTLAAGSGYTVGAPNAATVTIADNDVTAMVTVAATDANAAEAGLNTGVFTVSRTGSTAAALTVNYTVGGTATNGTDYQSLPGTVTIAAGAGSATITVTPIDDASTEGNETVTVTLAAGSGYTVGAPNAAMVTIADNDVAPAPSITLSFDGQIRDRVGGGETALSADGAADGTFTVTLSAASGNRTVTRLDLARTGEGNWDTQPNNNFWVAGAASGLDNPLFNAANGTVNFALTAGSSFRIFVSDFQARMFGTGSTFNLTVTFSDGSTAVASTGIAGQPTVTVAATDASAAEAGLNTGVFTVSRTGSTAAALTVNYTVGGTATNGTDYQSLPGTVTIAAGAGSATITVTPIDDASAEGNETVTVTLAAGSGYTVGPPNAAMVTIADNDVAPAPSITLSFDGQIRDRVGGGETALSADGAADGTFTVTLSAASGNRTVTRLDLARTGEGNWDTQPNNNFWVAGAASGLDNPLFNAANGTVNFALTAGSSFRIFVSDFQARMFGTGSSFNLTVTFSDGSTAVASTGIP